MTVCTRSRKCILYGGKYYDIVGCGALDAPNAPMVKLTQYGEIVEKYVIMPNHIHMIIVVDNNGTPRASSPTNAVIPHVISAFERWDYIEHNACKWREDCFYVTNAKKPPDGRLFCYSINNY